MGGNSAAAIQVKTNIKVMFPHSASPEEDYAETTSGIDPGLLPSDTPEQRQQKIFHANCRWDYEVGH